MVLFSCLNKFETTWLYIDNKSNFTLDSINAFINDYQLNFRNVKPDNEVKMSASVNEIKANHDVVYRFEIYIKDSGKITKHYFSNDMGYIPPICKVVLTDSLEIRRIE